MKRRRNAEERAQLKLDMPICRTCGVQKPAAEFHPAHASCVSCCRAKNAAYKRRMRLVFMRERRLAMLQKYLKSSCVDGECPVCGNERHEQGCSIGRLLIDLEVHGWLKKEPA